MNFIQKIIQNRKIEELKQKRMYLAVFNAIYQYQIDVTDSELTLPSEIYARAVKVMNNTVKNNKDLKRQYRNLIRHKCEQALM